MSLPLLPKSRFNALLQLVRPPSCKWHNALLASERFSLSHEQVEQLQQAIWIMYRHYTGTMTEEDKEVIGKQQQETFREVNQSTTYKWY